MTSEKLIEPNSTNFAINAANGLKADEEIRVFLGKVVGFSVEEMQQMIDLACSCSMRPLKIQGAVP
jgi:hypothetical protein